MARTRAVDFAEKQHAILVAAASVFAQQGMEKASMAQIALRAQVSKALLYHYYPSKDALIFGIVHTHLTDLEAAVSAADDASLPPTQRLEALVWAVLDNYRDADDAHTVQLNGTSALSDEQKDAIRAVERKIVKRFSDTLAEINPSLKNPERPLLMPVTMSLFGMLNWVYMWFRDGGTLTREDYGRLATTLILQGVGAVK
ncbi:MAG: TetR/AcrR family transcriptional regulator [Proteobacteria bacterium]|nr:TetR/AcrR family transcriptional regulator [Pseudomonadota bacterium]